MTSNVFVARRAYCVGEAPENHVCPFVRVSVSVRVCPSGPFWIQFLSSKVKIPVLFLSKRGPKKDPSGTFGSKSEMDLGQRVIQILWRFRTSSDSDEAHHQFWWAFPSGDLAPQVSSSTVGPDKSDFILLNDFVEIKSKVRALCGSLRAWRP